MLLRQTNASILVLNTDFTIYDVNDVFLRKFNKRKEDVLGHLCYKIIRGFKASSPFDQPEFRCPMVETLKTGESAFVMQEFPVSKDCTIYCNTVTYPLKDPDGNIVRVIELRRDVTEEISSKWEKRMKDIKANMKMIIQEDRMISLGKLVASCVHEINNPIQGVLTFSHLMQEMVADGLKDESDLEKFKKFLSLMSKELERCGEIVSGLLSFSRQSPMEYRDVSLNEVLESVIVLIRHKCELQKIRVITKLSKKPLMVQGDTNQLQQCFLNLIFNAIEAMREGGQLTVILKPVNNNRFAQVEIRDTGDGISEKNLDHIFDPFFTTKNEGEGTGLGLSIVYGVAKNHGGNIKVDSKEKNGTSFILTFPVK
jgi:signal transduction histidine kinase